MVERQFGIEIDAEWVTTTGGEANHNASFKPDLYVSQVRNELARILKSEAGRHLAASLRYHSKKILLVPYTGGDCNAQEWWWGSSAKDNYSMIRFSPATTGSPCAGEIKKRRAASLSHEVLFHELVHSLRRISGKMRGWNLMGTSLANQGNVEEFISVLVTNIFISDVTNTFKSDLRHGWMGNSPLDPTLAESYRFFALGTKAYNLIATFCDDNRGFTTMLSKIRAPFNPLAAYYQNPRKAFDIAADGDAESAFQEITPHDYVKDPDGVWKRISTFPGPSGKI